MLAREVPTSPKFRTEERGAGKKTDRFVVLLMVLGLAVFAGGASALAFTSLLFNQMLAVSGTSGTNILRISDKITDRQSAIYQNWEQVRGSLVLGVRSSVTPMTESAVLGTGLILTEDGWLVFPAAAISEQENKVAVVLGDHRMFPVLEWMRDPLTQLTFARIEASGLSPVEFFPTEMIATGLEALVFAQTLEGQPQVSTAMLQTASSARSLVPGDRVFSSEQISTQFLFATARKEQNGILTSLDGRVIGFVDHVDENGLTVTPAFWIQPILSSVFSDRTLVRIDLGLQWMNLERSPFLPEAKAQSLSTGALITDVTQSATSLKKGDIVLGVNGRPLGGFYDLNFAIQSLDPNTEAELSLLRNGEKLSIKTQLSARGKK